MSPARAHRQRMLAAKAAGTALTSAPAQHAGGAASEYEIMLAKLGLDLRELHDIQSLERKIDRKREMLPEYEAWVEGVLKGMLDSGHGVADEIFPTVMIWRIDTGDYVGALPLAAAVLRFKLALPERYKRTPATLICEEYADAALKAIGQGGDFDLRVLQAVEHMVADEDIFNIVQAKLHAAIGRLLAMQVKALEDSADGPAGNKRSLLAAAIERMKRARALDAKIGVKKELDGLERLAAKLAEAATANAGD